MNRMKTFLLTTRLALLGIAASAASLLIAWSGLTLPWYVEVVGHFQYGYAAAAAGALLVAAAMRARKDVRVLLAFGLPVFALQFASFDGLPHATASGSGTLTVIGFNAHHANEDAARLAGYVEVEDSDVVGIVELGPPHGESARGEARLDSASSAASREKLRISRSRSSSYPRQELLHQRSGTGTPSLTRDLVRVDAPQGSVIVDAHAPAAESSDALAGEQAAQFADFSRCRSRSTGHFESRWATSTPTSWSAAYRAPTALRRFRRLR